MPLTDGDFEMIFRALECLSMQTASGIIRGGVMGDVFSGKIDSSKNNKEVSRQLVEEADKLEQYISSMNILREKLARIKQSQK